MKYQQWDASVRGCKTFKDDCVVRSLSVVLGKPYARVFTDLMGIGQLMWAFPNHYKGIAIVRNSGHLTAVEHGYLIDTWDCRYRPVNSYWETI